LIRIKVGGTEEVLLCGIYPSAMKHPVLSTTRPAGTVSVLVWGLYLLLLGIALLLLPQPLMALFQLPFGGGFGERMLGVLTLVLGVYYVLAARHRITALYRWKIACHALGVCLMTLMILTGTAPLGLLGTIAMDVLAAVWTVLALRRGTAVV
jgi:hypothetical protein